MSEFNSIPDKPGNEHPKAKNEQKATISSFSSSLATDSSSLVDLKAEVFRKQQEASFNKIHGEALKLKTREGGKSKKDKIWSKRNITKRRKRILSIEIIKWCTIILDELCQRVKMYPFQLYITPVKVCLRFRKLIEKVISYSCQVYL